MAQIQNEPSVVPITDFKKPKVGLMDLPNEILEQVMQSVLIFQDGIELSPIESAHVQADHEPPLDMWQYSYALHFQQVIRPSLAVLRTCQKMQAEGSRVYYSQNTFKFSGRFGWLVLARFLDLIGPANMRLLRHLVVIHPRGELSFSTRDPEDLYVQRLSPFGMTDLPNYSATYDNVSRPLICPVFDPLKRLRDIPGLTRLDLLYYPTEIDSSDRNRKLFRHLVRTQDVSESLPSEQQLRLKIKFINMCHRDLRGEDPSIKLATIGSDARNPSLHWMDYNEAERLSQEVREHGWDLEDVEYCRHTGKWPLQPDQPDPQIEKPRYIDNAEGWINRIRFEREVEMSDDTDYPIWLDGLDYKNCVRCWRSNGHEGCICENGGAFLPVDWWPTGEIIGNPGQGLHVDIEKRVVKCQTDRAALDAEHRRNLGMSNWGCCLSRAVWMESKVWIERDSEETSRSSAHTGEQVEGEEPKDGA